jgi:hypothetical protein
MEKTAKEKQEHLHRALLILNRLGEEYGDWYGWPKHTPPSRFLALGEFIVELCEIEPHEEWFDAAKEAYLKWKKLHHQDITPPPNLKAK